MIEKIQLKIEGMSCGHCQMSVTKTIKENKGVQQAEVDLKTALADVVFDNHVISKQEIIDSVNKTGVYKAF